MGILCDETVLALTASRIPEVAKEAWAEAYRRHLVTERDIFAAEVGL